MKYLKLFDSVQELNAAVQSSEISFLGLAYNNGTPVTKNKVVLPPDYSEPFYVENITNSDETLTISSYNMGDVPGDYYEITVQYSTDGTTWSNLGTTSTTPLTRTLQPNEKVYLRANIDTWHYEFYDDDPFVEKGCRITGVSKVGGNIMSLLYGNSFTGNETTFPTDSQSIFNGVLAYNVNLIDASKLLLPATTLVYGCYSFMFASCTALTSTPILPATTMASNCYYRMFRGCTSLTTAPALPATTLTESCYHEMFYSCTSLTTAPTLPATTLTYGCYNGMFQNCSSLTTAPALPATTLNSSCYQGMFSNCTSLTTAPVLPATTLANSCYNNMFSGCTALTTAPLLPATILSGSCYQSMFSGCTSLTTAPALPVTTLNGSCYSGMFRGCTSLTTAPVLPATTLANSCYNYMFQGCTSLTTAPELPATTLVNYCYQQMFSGCINLNYIKCLATNISASNCTQNWVNGVAATGKFVKDPSMEGWTTGVNGIPSGWILKGITLTQSLNVATIKVGELDSGTGYYTINGGSQVALTEGTTTVPITQAMNGQTLLAHGEFNGETIETSIILYYALYPYPFYIEDISGSDNTVQITKSSYSSSTLTIEKSTDATNWTAMGTTSTTAITATVPANGRLYLRCNTTSWASENYYNTITTTGNCNVGGNIMSLLYGSNFTGNETTFPSGSTYNFKHLFYANTYLTDASDLILPATTLTNYCYQEMFYNCTSLTTAPALPATTLTNWCYKDMFYGCTSLTTAPALPATTLANQCYKEMFMGCTALTTAPAILPATTLASNCYGSMFYNCTALTSAPILPATTLTEDCYRYMFRDCTSLTTAPVLPATTLANGCYHTMFGGCTSLTTAPALPATTLANSCYNAMFYNCTSLTTAPVLPATTLVNYCYTNMFESCSNLNYIKCLATNISASSCIYRWVLNVAATGTFVKDPNMSSWTTGADGIPSGWTVEDATN